MSVPPLHHAPPGFVSDSSLMAGSLRRAPVSQNRVRGRSESWGHVLDICCAPAELVRSPSRAKGCVGDGRAWGLRTPGPFSASPPVARGQAGVCVLTEVGAPCFKPKTLLPHVESPFHSPTAHHSDQVLSLQRNEPDGSLRASRRCPVTFSLAGLCGCWPGIWLYP